jgi:3-ketosteroid 9alpha-monooxygenase subunit B
VSAVLQLRVVEVIEETEDARTIVLASDGGVVTYRPGQFLTLRIPDSGSGPAARCYSLSSSPAVHGDQLAVTVKRVPGGRGSAWICDEVGPGQVIDSLAPAGLFTPRDLDADLLLVAAGSGITPVMSILESALHSGRGRVALLYANRDERSVIFADRLARLEREYVDRLVVLHWLESLQGLPGMPALAARLGEHSDRETFLCGPAPFMAAVREALAAVGTTSSRLHVEEFVSLSGDPFAAPTEVSLQDDEPCATAEVLLDGSVQTVRWPRGQVLLDALLVAGLPAPYSCREGACSACACVVLEGEVALDHNDVLDTADLVEGIILACQATPITDRVRVSYDG